MRLGALGGAVLALLVAGPAMSQTLAGSEWQPVRLGAAVLGDEVEQYVRFEAEGRLVGAGGCNRFGGTYTIAGNGLSIGPLRATRMACPPPRMALEQALFQALEAARRFVRQRTELTLFDAGGDEVAHFRQRDWD